MVTLRCVDASDVPDIEVDLLWTDIPFGTGKVMMKDRGSYKDAADIGYVFDALRAWTRVVARDGVIVVCCDYRAAAGVQNAITGEDWCFRGEIIWEFGLGRPRTNWWPVRHNNLLTFTRTEASGVFRGEYAPRERRLAPKKGYADDKPAGSVWNFTMSNTDPERVDYPNQKPLAVVEPFILCHTLEGDMVADPFMGSGTTGVAALKHGRRFYGGDISPDAVVVASERLTTPCQLTL